MSLDLDRIPRVAPGPQARVNWSHPLAAGLLGVGLADRIIHGYQGVVGAGALFGALSPTLFGRGRAGNNAAGPNGAKLCDYPAQTDATEFTFTFVGAPGAGTDPLVGYRTGGGPGITFAKIYGTNVQYYSNGNNRYTAAHGLASTTPGVLHLVKRGLVIETWLNGARVNASSAFTTGQLDQNAAVCYWMQGDEGDANHTASRCVLVAMHNRALNGAEFAQLFADPFCFLTEE